MCGNCCKEGQGLTMTLTIYNTLSRQHEVFTPLEEGKVKVYVCGITPYDHSHIGHARPAVFWDVVRRYFSYKGYHVTFVTNLQILMKAINKSKQTGIPLMDIANKYAQEYVDCLDKLGVQRADAYPRASQVIPDIIETEKVLIDKGVANESSGDVYFRAGKFEDYGKLSGRNIEDLMPGARVQVSELKESPLDWALWKASREGEPGWPSPWGKGRPGWHIECSVMVHKYLGPSIDLHGGGTELVFPHHENEIAGFTVRCLTWKAKRCPSRLATWFPSARLSRSMIQWLLGCICFQLIGERYLSFLRNFLNLLKKAGSEFKQATQMRWNLFQTRCLRV